MGKAVFSIIALGLFVFATMAISQNLLASFDTVTSEFVGLSARTEDVARTDIEPVSTAVLPGRQIVEITLRNTGESKISDFESWDVTVQYYDYLDEYHTTWLTWVDGTPGDNQWSVKGIYIDAADETPELMETGVLNPGEEIIIRAKLSPKVHLSANNLAIVSTADGVKTWNYFRYMLLYLHNNPTPPTANTSAQADLPLSYAVPSATTLYDYDGDLGGHEGQGRLIERSTANVTETDLALYQNWRVLFSTCVYDTLAFDSSSGRTPDMLHIAGDVYAVAYRGSANEGIVKTVEVSANGSITDTGIDSLVFDATRCLAPRIVRVSADVYAVAYQGTGDNGMLRTVEIASTGNITDTVIDTLQFDGTVGLTPSILHAGGDIYGIAYRGVDDDGYLVTVEIDAGGAITDAVIDSLEFDALAGREPNIVNVSGDIYAIAYRGDGDAGTLATVEITSGGAITDTVIDTFAFDGSYGGTPDIAHVDGDVYAVAYNDSADAGTLRTLEIGATGNITAAVIDSLVFDMAQGHTPVIFNISGDVYAMVYQGADDDGYVKTVEVSANGTIADAVIDSLEYDIVLGDVPCIVPVRGNIYAVAYQGDGSAGYIKTVQVLPDGTFGTDIDIDGDVDFYFWSGLENFTLSSRGVVTACLRDFDGADYTEIASQTLDSPDWQGGVADWVEATMTFSGVSYTLPAGHYLELKLFVADASDEDMLFAYDTETYNSYLKLP